MDSLCYCIESPVFQLIQTEILVKSFKTDLGAVFEDFGKIFLPKTQKVRDDLGAVFENFGKEVISH